MLCFCEHIIKVPWTIIEINEQNLNTVDNIDTVVDSAWYYFGYDVDNDIAMTTDE